MRWQTEVRVMKAQKIRVVMPEWLRTAEAAQSVDIKHNNEEEQERHG